jgi:hypothetical protein
MPEHGDAERLDILIGRQEATRSNEGRIIGIPSKVNRMLRSVTVARGDVGA